MTKIEKTDLEELIEHRIISIDTAAAIENYYKNKADESPSKLLLVFGILGSLLGGLGIILVFAHNWDDFSIKVKCIISLVPLAVGQFLCGYVLIKKPESLVWRESSTAFLFLSIGASIALIAQTYNIPGDFSSFMLTWSLLGLPLVYILKSQIASFLYLIGITTFCVSKNYLDYPTDEDYWYWLSLRGRVELLTGKFENAQSTFQEVKEAIDKNEDLLREVQSDLDHLAQQKPALQSIIREIMATPTKN